MSKRKVKEKNFVSIQAFMVNDLHLSGNELIIYAVIYGFSQDENSWFVGSRSYLAAWCQTSEKSVTNNIKKLLAKGLLRKRTKTEHGCTFNDYQAVVPISIEGKKVPSTGEESSPSTGEESSPHTLDTHTSSENTSSSVPYAEIIGYLNEKRGKNFRHTTADYRREIHARWVDEGKPDIAEFVKKCKYVIDVKCADWLGTDLENNLNPKTLFRAANFDRYANQSMPSNHNDRKSSGTFSAYADIPEERILRVKGVNA